MDVNASLELGPEEVQRLATILACGETQLATKLRPYAAAALEEYVRMFVGQRVFTRGSDMREYRLLLIMQHVHKGQVPDERVVSSLFQTTAGQSRGLVRSVLSKFQYELETGVAESLRGIVNSARWEPDRDAWFADVRAVNLIEAINTLTESIRADLPPVIKSPGTIARYEIKPSTFNALCDALDVPRRERE